MQQEWLMGLIGGVFLGVSATVLLVASGKIAGISGIFYGALTSKKGDWRLFFLLGLIVSGFVGYAIDPELFVNNEPRPISVLLLAGFLVGFGTKLGSGCTSGHGICGMSRLSLRSVVATLCFIFSGAVMVMIYLFSPIFKGLP